MQVNRPRIMMKAQMTSSSSFFSLNKSTGAVHVTCQRIKRYAAYQYLQSVERTREGSPGKEKRRAGDLPAAVQMSGSEVADREAGWGRPCGHVDGSISLFTVCNLVMRVIGEGGCLGIHSQALLVFRCSAPRCRWETCKGDAAGRCPWMEPQASGTRAGQLCPTSGCLATTQAGWRWEFASPMFTQVERAPR